MGGLRIAVFGSGAVGGYFGGRLAEAGEDVHFIARGEHLAAIREHGLRVSSTEGDFLVRPARVTDDPSGLGPLDVVLLGVKAWQVPRAAEAMRPLLGEGAFVVPLQNGIEAPEQLAAVFGPGRVLGGLCRILAYVESPGHTRHAGVAPYIAFGELDGTSSARVDALQQAFSRARGVTVEVPGDIGAAMWSKFVFIAALSGVGALTRAPIGVIRSQPESRGLLEQALEEIYAVAVGNRIALPADTVEKTLAFIDGLPAHVTASMQRDIIQGRPSELEAQVGAVVRLGERRGIAVPVHRMIYAALLPLERRARGELEFST
ncbi:MAG TPA: 2-dehydropantoate 2-reductase [Gemmatimonadales bacterium]|nr:2-dehydropantoate 2-reductase [Gemmatimonadales bacterium]